MDVRLLVAVAVLLASSRAAAQDAPYADAGTGADAEAARARYDLGSRAFKEKRFAESALHFEAAATLRPHFAPLLMAGRAWAQAGQPARAADAYARLLDAPDLAPEIGAQARERVAELERSLGTVLVLSKTPRKVRLHESVEIPTPARLHASAGPHELTVRDLSGQVVSRYVTLQAGQVVEVDVEDWVTPAQAMTAQALDLRAERLSARPSGSRTPVVLVSSGAIALAAAGALWWRANAVHEAYRASPTEEERTTGIALLLGTNVVTVAGVALVSLGTWSWLKQRRQTGLVDVAVSPQGILMSGVF